MKQTVKFSHGLFSADDTLEVLPRVYQGDIGAVEIAVSFTKNGVAASLDGWAVSVTNRAPNGDMVMTVGGGEAPLAVSGDTVTWTLGVFDTQQIGTYRAQMRVATDAQTVTVVFIEYNVEKSVNGNSVTVPVQYTTLSALAGEIKALREEIAEMEKEAAEMRELYELFMQIITDGGVTWETLLNKPETFPPSPHFHTEFQTFTTDIAALEANQEGMVREIANEWVVIPASAWVYNKLKLRYETTVTHEKIAPNTDVDFQVSDDLSGQFSLCGLFPQEGTITLYTYNYISYEIQLLLRVTEVFSNGTEVSND